MTQLLCNHANDKLLNILVCLTAMRGLGLNSLPLFAYLQVDLGICGGQALYLLLTAAGSETREDIIPLVKMLSSSSSSCSGFRVLNKIPVSERYLSSLIRHPLLETQLIHYESTHRPSNHQSQSCASSPQSAPDPIHAMSRARFDLSGNDPLARLAFASDVPLNSEDTTWLSFVAQYLQYHTHTHRLSQSCGMDANGDVMRNNPTLLFGSNSNTERLELTREQVLQAMIHLPPRISASSFGEQNGSSPWSQQKSFKRRAVNGSPFGSPGTFAPISLISTIIQPFCMRNEEKAINEHKKSSSSAASSKGVLEISDGSGILWRAPRPFVKVLIVFL